MNKFDVVAFYPDKDLIYRLNNTANYSYPRLLNRISASSHCIGIIEFTNSSSATFYSNGQKVKSSIWKFIRNLNSGGICVLSGRLNLIMILYVKLFRKGKIIFRTGGAYKGTRSVFSSFIRIVDWLNYHLVDLFVSTRDGTPVFHLVRRYGISPSKVFVRENGYNLSNRDLSTPRNNMCVMSRFAPEKKLELQMSAFDHFIRGIEHRGKLDIFGEGPCRSEMNEYIKDVSNKSTILLRPYLSNSQERLLEYKINLAGLSYNSGIEGITTSTPTVLFDFWETRNLFRYDLDLTVVGPVLNGFTLDNFNCMNRISTVLSTSKYISNQSNSFGQEVKNNTIYHLEWDYRVNEELRRIGLFI